ncbi:MAG: PRC-barrel domain-containing protein [Parcubacteria group bacterium]|nr:PRC-barrel domain-containing protein [Parcubacteria group bacterium]
MLIDIKGILGLPVETQSGTHLGKVEAVVVEIETQALYQYQVKPAGISHLFDTAGLLIHRDQVISITKEKMVVEDSVRAAVQASEALAKNKPQLGAVEAITRHRAEGSVR